MDLSVCGMSYTYIVSCICRIMLGCRPLSSLVSGQESTHVRQIRYMKSDTLISNAQIPLVYPVENLVADPGFWPGFRQVRASLRRAHGKFANFCVCDQVWDLAFDWIDKWNFGLRVNGARCQSRRSAENEVPCRTLQRRMGDTIVSKSSHTHTHTHTHTHRCLCISIRICESLCHRTVALDKSAMYVARPVDTWQNETASIYFDNTQLTLTWSAIGIDISRFLHDLGVDRNFQATFLEGGEGILHRLGHKNRRNIFRSPLPQLQICSLPVRIVSAVAETWKCLLAPVLKMSASSTNCHSQMMPTTVIEAYIQGGPKK